ncbi:MAG: SufE family protein [Myxococcales bacterium]|nr:SufE family protein [Myxococcales bacterium]
MDLAQLADDFAFFDSWEEKYRYLIDLGRDLPPMDDADKTEGNRVTGCISKVWVKPRRVDGDPPRLEFDADSDSVIVRGLVAVARALFHGKTREEIRSVDVDEVFRTLGFDAHISVNRRNGFQSMVRLLQAHAEAL